jgi:hypothetical protein
MVDFDPVTVQGIRPARHLSIAERCPAASDIVVAKVTIYNKINGGCMCSDCATEQSGDHGDRFQRFHFFPFNSKYALDS